MKHIVLDTQRETEDTFLENSQYGKWRCIPYGLVSLLEMLRFFASDWNQIIRELEYCSKLWIMPDGVRRLIDGDHEVVTGPLERLANLCKKLGMDFSESYAREMIEEVNASLSLKEITSREVSLITSGQSPAHTTLSGVINLKKLEADVNILRKRIDDELKEREFFAVQTPHREYFSNPELFGVSVFNNYHSAIDDICEAGTCLALDRSTACVMHLSRVLELGLKVLAKTIGVPEQNDWGKYIHEIDCELQRRIKVSGARTPDEQFYAEAAVTFDALRRAWRNPSMHPTGNYSPERAEEILIAIRSFMRHLATKLSEKKEISTFELSPQNLTSYMEGADET
jgi:hypothetical protein